MVPKEIIEQREKNSEVTRTVYDKRKSTVQVSRVLMEHRVVELKAVSYQRQLSVTRTEMIPRTVMDVQMVTDTRYAYPNLDNYSHDHQGNNLPDASRGYTYN
jgi:hypothetical protein